MLLNERLRGSLCTLVPYRPEHVPIYHAWMQDPELREATASEPLTLEQEYAMQRSWQTDKDKLTFIITAEQLPIGDVNLFMSDDEEDLQTRAECEVMVAVTEHRRRGIARQALQMMMHYAATKLKLPANRFFCRISLSNAASIALFESLGFVRYKEIAVFGEVELRHSRPSFGFESPVIA